MINLATTMPTAGALGAHRMLEVQELRPGLAIWSRYDSAVKADLFSTAITARSGTFLIDPIALGGENLPDSSAVTGIIVTNANHLRASADFAKEFSAPVYASRETEIPRVRELRDGDLLDAELQIIAIEGAAPGEVALFSKRHDGILIMGDALINFGSNGFAFLPAKYCADAKRMRKSLRRLLDLNFEQMLFAHGTPIMNRARDRLATLLAGQK